MNVNPYLIFNGDCEAAFTFYAQATGGELGPMMRFDGMEGCGDIPPEYGQKIMHTHVMFGQTVLMGSDNHPAQPYEGVKGCSVSLCGQHQGGRAHLRRAVRRRPGDHATGTDVLGGALRHAGGQVRRAVDDQLREGCVMTVRTRRGRHVDCLRCAAAFTGRSAVV